MIGRRDLMIAAVASAAPAGSEPPAPAAPGLDFVFEARLRIGELRDLSVSPLGGRQLVPILGGTFEGPTLRGEVLSGTARHLVRRDGFLQLTAELELRTREGVPFTYSDHALRDGSAKFVRGLGNAELTAPVEGPLAWMNRRVFVCTLDPVPTAEGVRIRQRVYALRWSDA